MKFENRQTQFPGRKKVRRIDSNNQQIGEEYFVVTENCEGNAEPAGTPLSAENLNRGNWRDDKSISFSVRDDDELPPPLSSGTQIVTKANGETWLIPPGPMDPQKIGQNELAHTSAISGITYSADIPNTALGVETDLLTGVAQQKPVFRAGNGISIAGGTDGVPVINAVGGNGGSGGDPEDPWILVINDDTPNIITYSMSDYRIRDYDEVLTISTLRPWDQSHLETTCTASGMFLDTNTVFNGRCVEPGMDPHLYAGVNLLTAPSDGNRIVIITPTPGITMDYYNALELNRVEMQLLNKKIFLRKSVVDRVS